MDSYDCLFKILIVGDMGVGKSSLLLRYSDDKFDYSYISTIGVDFKIKTIDLDGKRIKLQMWDTAGQERFRTITHSYYRGAHAVVVVFDLTDEKTFENLGTWLYDIKTHANPEITKICIGNKSDLVTNRKISYSTGCNFAEKIGMDYIETSAKNSVNVDIVFERLIRKLLIANIKAKPHTPIVLKSAVINPGCEC